MALVNGPLFSLGASGQLGKAIVYSKWKGRDYVREYVIPANPKTLAQHLQRGILTALSRWWMGLGTVVGAQGSWDSLAASKQISPFNAFVQDGLNREALNENPYGAAGGTLGTTPAGEATAITGSSPAPGKVALTVDYDGVAAGDLIIVTIGTPSGANTTSHNINRVLTGQASLSGTGSIEFDISDLPFGDFFFGTNALGSNGTLATWAHTATAIDTSGP